MKISDIKWGSDSAEKDPNLLKYFVEHSSSSFERLYACEKTYIVGRKGAGKSAVRKKIVDEFSKYSDITVDEITLNYGAVKGIVDMGATLSEFNNELFFEYVWLDYLYKSGLIALGQKSPKDSTLFSFARELAIANEKSSKGLLQNVAELLTKVKISAGKFGNIGIDIDYTMRKEANIEKYEREIQKIANNGFKVVWVIDDLDIGWRNTPTSINFLLGLLLAANKIKEVFPENHIFISIREDIFRLLMMNTTHSDKFRGDVEKILWTNTSLLDLLQARIRFNYKNPEMSVNDVFPETIGTHITSNWLIERTLQRPRELLQLARIYSETITSETPDADVLKDVEQEYSKWKLDDLCTEYKEQYPDLKVCFDVWKAKFPRTKYHLNLVEYAPIMQQILNLANVKADWFLTLKSTKNIAGFLEILYEIGFIGDFIQGGTGGSKTMYSYKDIHHAPIFSEIQVHPCFRRAIDTVERNR